MTAATIEQSISGFFSGTGIVLSYSSSKNVQQGQTDYMAFKQSARISSLISFAFFVREQVHGIATTASTRRWTARLLSIPIPFALQILNAHVKLEEHPRLKQSILFARNHVEHGSVTLFL